MVRKTKRSQIEDSALSDDNGSDKTLTSDLPSRARTKRNWSLGKLVPAFIIIFAGLLGFLIPTFQRTEDAGPKSLSYGSNNDSGSEVEQVEPVITYKDVKYATVSTNDVGFLNVRAEATASSTKLGTLDIGDKLEVIEETETWVKVKLSEPLGGKSEGWVSAEYVNIETEKVQE